MSLEKFDSVAAAVKALTDLASSEELLELYALYKQATIGDIDIEEDPEADDVAKAKRSAWESKKGMTQEDAKAAYIDFAEPLIEKYNSE